MHNRGNTYTLGEFNTRVSKKRHFNLSSSVMQTRRVSPSLDKLISTGGEGVGRTLPFKQLRLAEEKDAGEKLV